MKNELFIDEFLENSVSILSSIDRKSIDKACYLIKDVKDQGGRIFFAGSGGGAGHSSHAACDFRKIVGIESYSVTDNVSELTARVNDESWADSYANWIRIARPTKKDCIVIFSVGGGSVEKNISMNLVNLMKYGKESGCRIIGVVGRDGGYLKQVADVAILVPTMNPNYVTAQVEGFQALIWHLIVCSPILDGATPKWESTR
jgi:D-sedoheptulose 7-phosphate isomerase